MLSQNVYQAKLNLESFSDSNIQALINYYYPDIPSEASRNDTLWLLALRIQSHYAQMPENYNAFDFVSKLKQYQKSTKLAEVWEKVDDKKVQAVLDALQTALEKLDEWMIEPQDFEVLANTIEDACRCQLPSNEKDPASRLDDVFWQLSDPGVATALRSITFQEKGRQKLERVLSMIKTRIRIATNASEQLAAVGEAIKEHAPELET